MTKVKRNGEAQELPELMQNSASGSVITDVQLLILFN